MSEGEIEAGRRLLDVRRPEEALGLLGTAAARAPQDPEPQALISRALIDLERYVEASQAARRAISLHPEYSYPHRLLAVSQSALEDHKGARASIETALRLDPLDPRNHLVHGQVEAGAGKLGRAVRAAEQAVHSGPEFAPAHELLGRMLLHQRRLVAAEQAFTQALRIEPDHADALSGLAIVRLRRGDIEPVAPMLEQAARNDVRGGDWEYDLLRFVRGAAGGLATYPVIGGLVLFGLISLIAFVTGDGEALEAVALYLGAAAVLGGLRWNRMRRLSPAVRAWVHRRTRARDVRAPLDGPTGFRPWWWLLLIRIPLGVRVALLVVWAGFSALAYRRDPTGENLGDLLIVAIPAVAVVIYAIWRKLRERSPHPLYG